MEVSLSDGCWREGLLLDTLSQNAPLSTVQVLGFESSASGDMVLVAGSREIWAPPARLGLEYARTPF